MNLALQIIGSSFKEVKNGSMSYHALIAYKSINYIYLILHLYSRVLAMR